MSDKIDIIRVTDLVTPAEGFADRVEQVVDSAGTVLGEVERNPRRCDNGDCARPMGHEGEHFNGTEKWGDLLDFARGPETQCNRRYDGMRCALSKGHSGRHVTNDGRGDSPIEWNESESDLVVAAEGAPPVKKMSIADIPRPPQGGFLTPQQIQDFARRDAPVVKPQATKKQPWTVSIGAEIPPKQTITVQQPMQLYFKAKQMMCAADGGRVYLRSIFVGQRVQLMQWNENGTRVDFLKDKFDVDFDACPPGLFITVQVENRGDTLATFDMTLFGEAVM